jgi:hypothetical protein
MTQYDDRYILGAMLKILARLLFLIASRIISGENDIAFGNLISDYADLVERVDLWRNGK